MPTASGGQWPFEREKHEDMIILLPCSVPWKNILMTIPGRFHSYFSLEARQERASPCLKEASGYKAINICILEVVAEAGWGRSR